VSGRDYISSPVAHRRDRRYGRAARRLGVPRNTVYGALHALYHAILEATDDDALRHLTDPAEFGDLSDWEIAEIAEAADWEADEQADAFVEALEAAGFLERSTNGGLQLCRADCEDFVGPLLRYVKAQGADRERKRRGREQDSAPGVPADVLRTREGHPTDGRGLSGDKEEGGGGGNVPEGGNVTPIQGGGEDGTSGGPQANAADGAVAYTSSSHEDAFSSIVAAFEAHDLKCPSLRGKEGEAARELLSKGFTAGQIAACWGAIARGEFATTDKWPIRDHLGFVPLRDQDWVEKWLRRTSPKLGAAPRLKPIGQTSRDFKPAPEHDRSAPAGSDGAAPAISAAGRRNGAGDA
jgi:hypothetical protein